MRQKNLTKLNVKYVPYDSNKMLRDLCPVGKNQFRHNWFDFKTKTAEKKKKMGIFYFFLVFLVLGEEKKCVRNWFLPTRHKSRSILLLSYGTYLTFILVSFFVWSQAIFSQLSQMSYLFFNCDFLFFLGVFGFGWWKIMCLKLIFTYWAQVSEHFIAILWYTFNI